MKKIFFYIMSVVMLLSCDQGFAADTQSKSKEAASSQGQGWMPFIRSYLPSTSQALPYVIPVAAVGAQALALPQLVSRGYMSPEWARRVSLAAGVTAPAISNWLQYQQVKENPALVNLSYFLPSALMVAINWATAGGNMRDLSGMLMQYAYTWPVSLAAATSQGAGVLQNISSLSKDYEKEKEEYATESKNLSSAVQRLIDSPESQFDLRTRYEELINFRANLESKLATIREVYSDLGGLEDLDYPWVTILGTIVGHFVKQPEGRKDALASLGSAVASQLSSLTGDLDKLIKKTLADNYKQIKDVLERGGVFDLLDSYLTAIRDGSQDAKVSSAKQRLNEIVLYYIRSAQ